MGGTSPREMGARWCSGMGRGGIKQIALHNKGPACMPPPPSPPLPRKMRPCSACQQTRACGSAHLDVLRVLARRLLHMPLVCTA